MADGAACLQLRFCCNFSRAAPFCGLQTGGQATAPPHMGTFPETLHCRCTLLFAVNGDTTANKSLKVLGNASLGTAKDGAGQLGTTVDVKGKLVAQDAEIGVCKLASLQQGRFAPPL